MMTETIRKLQTDDRRILQCNATATVKYGRLKIRRSNNTERSN